jgi:arsenical pump membrane protein
VHGTAAELFAAALLVATLAVAVARPRGISEAVVAVPAAVLLVATDVVPWSAAERTLREIGPTVGFLAAILAFGHLCADAGVFSYLGTLAARASDRRPSRLLALVVALAAGVTVVLTLDATVVLLTPVVVATTVAMRVPGRPHVYACARLANSGSLLLPVSNLTNLLAFGASGLSFARFAGLMALPWVVACAAEWGALRTFFRRDLDARTVAAPPRTNCAPRYALTVLAVTVAGFVLTSSFGVNPAWAALGGCVLLVIPRVAARTVEPLTLVRETNPGFLVFVLGLAVVVDGVTRHGLGKELGRLLPDGTGLGALLLIALIGAALANLVNNLPATLALVPLVAGSPAAVLALLLGVNIGPNATYPGSLATLLWRRLLPSSLRPRAVEFHRLGALTVLPLLVVTTCALWVAIGVLGT